MSIITSGGIPSLHSPAKSPLHNIFSAKTNDKSKGRNQLNFVEPSDGKTLQIRTARPLFGGTRSIRHKMQRKSASFICQSSLNATCVALQPLSSERISGLTLAPIKDEIKAPRLDNDGPRLPPRGGGYGGKGDGGGGGRGGGGGYGFLYGGFFLLLFLGFIAHLKDQKEEENS